MRPSSIANRYDVLRALGEGAMGQVLLVRDTATGQEVALKLISQAFGTNERTLLQFKQEFRLMAQLRHPNCCCVHDYGVAANGEPWITMEHVPGHGLDELLPLPGPRVIAVLAQLLLALGYLHGQGLIYRDLKSANVRLMPDGTVKLMDFGLMEYAGQPSPEISGTLAYMAPELFKHTPIDQRADLYAVGVLAYELVTGQLPFQAERRVALVHQHLSERPRPPSELVPEIPPALERVIMRLLAKEPFDRYPGAYEVLVALGIEPPAGLGGTLLASPLLGRDRELSVLRQGLWALLNAQPTPPVFVHGPPGIGKSRLVEAFRHEAQLEHVPVAVGACMEEGVLPYAPFVRALRALLPQAREHLAGPLQRLAPVLAKLLGELNAVPAPELEPASKEKLRLQAAVTELFTRLARVRSFVLVLENWQWADPLSEELLGYLTRNLASAPLFLLVTSRYAPEPLPEWAAGVRLLPLGLLEAGQLQALVLAMLGERELPAPFLAQIEALTAGNPFFVEQALDHLVKARVLVKRQGRWNLDADLTLASVPRNLTALLADKLGPLAGLPLLLARLAAVAGREAPLELLQAAAGCAEEAFLDALHQLNSAGILVSGEGGACRFGRHGYRELLYEAMPADEKLRLHGLVARALEARVAGDTLEREPIERVAAIATHYLHCTDADRTLMYALEAGRRFAAMHAQAQARHFLGAGIALAARVTRGARAWQRLELLRTLADVERVTGLPAVAIPLYREAIALAERLGEARGLAEMYLSLAKALQTSEHYDDALAMCAEGLHHARAHGNTRQVARSYLTSCRIHYFNGRIPLSLAEAQLGLEHALAAGVPYQIGEAKAFLGYLFLSVRPTRASEGLALLESAAGLLAASEDLLGLNNVLNLQVTAFMLVGDYPAARRCAEQELSITRQLGAHDEQAFAAVNLACARLAAGDYREAASEARLAAEAAAGHASSFARGLALGVEGLASARLARFTTALACSAEAMKLAVELDHRYMQAIATQYRLEACLLIGLLGEAEQLALTLGELLAAHAFSEVELPFALARAELRWRQGDLAGAREACQALDAACEAQEARGVQLQARLLLGRLALAHQQVDEARRLATAALASTQAGKASGCAIGLLLLLGDCALADGEPMGREHFAAAEALAEAQGELVSLALAYFGRAAASPEGLEAQALAACALEVLETAASELSADDQRAFFACAERARVARGEYKTLAAAPKRKVNPFLRDQARKL